MSNILGHLSALIQPTNTNHGGDERGILQEWSKCALEASNSDHSGDEIDAIWQSALDIYASPHASTSQSSDSVVTRLLAKPHFEASMLNSLASVMSSNRPSEAISEDLAEICGFDDMELVMEILANRARVLEEIQQHMSSTPDTGVDHLSLDNARTRLAQNMRENAARPLFTHTATAAPEILPHVYTSSSMIQGNVLSDTGKKYMLPIGTERRQQELYDEVIIPPARAVPPKTNERLITIGELDPLAKGSFPGYSSLNRVQSIVYPTAYLSNENMLICAPTGAGKTDVAMLTILRAINQHRNTSQTGPPSATINRESFKIVYVAPMKALASEIVRKLGKRLHWLSIQVRELTGDMQLTRAEIAQTQIIVTTPEKWDVVTRKPTGEGELASLLKLLIIDEVHLLNEERGAVIETIIARTLRQVESSQSVIRIVGLSATLPNYVDVAEFLSVSKQKGLFYFDSSFRPVPLEQHFIGIKGKAGSQESKKNLDTVTFEKVSELVGQGHQVMVFVHARKETVKSATTLREMAQVEGNADDFLCDDHPQYAIFRRNIGESRNKEMKLLFDSGFGIHHAGMLRSDRNMMERMFEARAIKVLCCTATLAWGVNLPAHAVVIKGTQVYDSSKGSFVDLSVLDVLQVFGRAGRPGLESSGEGYICTTDDKLVHYLDAVTSQNPIESQFSKGIIDSLNAEIALGTVASVPDAVKWMGYTYMFVRMRKNPFVYGIPRDELVDDPQLGSKRTQLVTTAAQHLAEARMIIFDRSTGTMTTADIGRIAAKYYIRHGSIVIFNKELKPKMSEADVLGMLSMSTEFDQLQVRESEMKELEQLQEMIPCEVKGGPDTKEGKVNILLQGFISKLPVEDFALVSDTAYAAQNGGRIARALLEIGISRKWATVTAALMGISKAIEKRMWPFDQPLKQFELKPEVFYHLQQWADEWSPAEFTTLGAEELGKLIHLNEHHGRAVLNAAKQFPSVKMTYSLRPLGFDVLKVAVSVQRSFDWNVKVHGHSEAFWLWLEDKDGLNVLQMSHLTFSSTTESQTADFLISIRDGRPPASVTIRYVSDRWIGAEDEVVVPLDSLYMPRRVESNTTFLDLPLFPLSIINNPNIERGFRNRVISFNGLQSQTLWTLLQTKSHALLCGPSGCGKSTLAELVICNTMIKSSHASALIVVPRRSVAGDVVASLRSIASSAGLAVEYGSGPNILTGWKQRTVRVVTATQLLEVLTQLEPTAKPPTIDLVVLDHLEQLDAAYELAVSILLHATQTMPTRYIGLSHSLIDPTDLAAWLGVTPYSLFSFRPRDRTQSLSVSTQTFSMSHSASLLKAMAKPCHSAIKGQENAIVFVPSRGQCRRVALDLITQATLESDIQSAYLPPEASVYIEGHLLRLHDQSLMDIVSQGVGLFHEGLHRTDRNLMLELYVEGIIKVMIVPRESCWSLPVRAAVVVVLGTQYTQFGAESSSRRVVDYELTELVHMQSRAIRHSRSGHFHLFCQAESKEGILRFLNDGLPLESTLAESPQLSLWWKGTDRRHLADMLSFTFLARRLETNPAYYDCDGPSLNHNISKTVDRIMESLAS